MSNIIEFPGKERRNGFINSEVSRALEKLDDKVRKEIEEIINSTCAKYDFVCDSISLRLPEQVTEDQVKEIEQILMKQQNAIVELVNELINQKIINEIRK